MDAASIIAMVTAAASLIGSLIKKAQDVGITGLSPMPYLQAAAAVSATLATKIVEAVKGTGPDFAKMTPDQIHAYFTAKTADELEAEVHGAASFTPKA